MSRETWVPLASIAAIAIVAGLTWSWFSRTSEAARETEREARRRERETHAVSEMREESDEILGHILPGVALGMDLDEVRRARLTVAPSTQHVDPGFELYDETLPNGAQVVYAFEQHTGVLERVQLLSTLDDVEAIAPHLAALQDRYGTPTGVWDCTDEGGLSTRRFTWRRSHVGIADIVLLYGTRVSLTLYVTTNEQMARSLQRSGCRPTPPDAIDRFPTADPSLIEREVQREEGARPR